MNKSWTVLLRSLRCLLATLLLLGLLGVAMGLVCPCLVASYHLRAARLALKQYHHREAIRHLQLCLKIWPSDAEALFLAARIARRIGNFVEAEIALNKYESQRGCDEAAERERILLRVERGDVDRCAGFCKYWIEQDYPDAPFIFEAMVHGYLHVYRLLEARRLLQRWRQAQPDNPQTFFVEGEIDDCEGMAAEATACYRQVLQIDPQHEEAHLKLTAALLEQRAFTEAVPHLEHLRQCQPDNLLVLVRLAACRAFLGKSEEAVRLLEDVLTRQPNFAPALAERGKIALDCAEYAAAEHWLREAVTRNPSDQLAGYNLVQCLRRLGKEVEAQEQEQRLYRLEADLKRLGEIVRRDMSQTPHNAALHCEVSVLFLRNGLIEPGLQWLNSAVQLDMRCTAAHQALAKYYQQIGYSELAEQHRRFAATTLISPAKSGDH